MMSNESKSCHSKVGCTINHDQFNTSKNSRTSCAALNSGCLVFKPTTRKQHKLQEASHTILDQIQVKRGITESPRLIESWKRTYNMHRIRVIFKLYKKPIDLINFKHQIGDINILSCDKIS